MQGSQPCQKVWGYLVLDLGSRNGQVIIVSLEGGFGVSLLESQEGLVYEVILVDLDVMPADDHEDVRGNCSLERRLGDPLRWRERGILVINYLLFDDRPSTGDTWQRWGMMNNHYHTFSLSVVEARRTDTDLKMFPQVVLKDKKTQPIRRRTSSKDLEKRSKFLRLNG